MNILNYHRQNKGISRQRLSHLTGMDYYKVCRLMKQDQDHIETQLQASLELIELFKVLGLTELSEAIKSELNTIGE